MSKLQFSCGANVKELQESEDLKRGYFMHIDTEAEIKKQSRKQSETVGRLMGLQAWD